MKISYGDVEQNPWEEVVDNTAFVKMKQSGKIIFNVAFDEAGMYRWMVHFDGKPILCQKCTFIVTPNPTIDLTKTIFMPIWMNAFSSFGTSRGLIFNRAPA
jgi:hypothetical protein